jgi:hypothetical protein
VRLCRFDHADFVAHSPRGACPDYRIGLYMRARRRSLSTVPSYLNLKQPSSLVIDVLYLIEATVPLRSYYKVFIPYNDFIRRVRGMRARAHPTLRTR